MALQIIFKGNKNTVFLSIAPEKKIDFTGPREIAKLDIPGYKSVYQDMGQGERTAKWSGLIEEASALATAETLRAMMDAGKEIKFIYGEISAVVLIKEFNYQYYRDNYVRYDITLLEVDGLNVDADGVNMPPATKATPGFGRGQSLADGLVSILLQGVVQGDTLRSISTRLFGSPHDWYYIARINGFTSSTIPAGIQHIKVPATIGALLALKTALDKKTLPPVMSNFIARWKR